MSLWIFIAKLQSFNRPVYGRNITSKISPALYRMELYRMELYRMELYCKELYRKKLYRNK
jgi:hypothetical protein